MSIPDPFDAKGSAVDEPIDVEFVASAWGEVSVPVDEADPDGGSARCLLPDELVKTTYPATALATVVQTLPLNQRIVSSVPVAAHHSPYDLGAYDGCVTDLEEQFPVRIARLRELYATCRQAEERQRSLWQLRELERQALNRRNQESNKLIQDEIVSLRKEWKEEREHLVKALKEAEKTQVDYHQERQKAIREAREAYFTARHDEAERQDTRNAELQDIEGEAAQKRREADLEVRRSVIKQHQEAVTAWEEQREQAWKRAQESEVRAVAAEKAAYEAELAAIQRHSRATAEARARYEELLAAAQGDIDDLWKTTQTSAGDTRADLLSQRAELERELRELHAVSAQELERRAAAARDAKSKAAAASARAGLRPDETTGDYHETLEARSGSIGTPDDFLDDHRKHYWWDTIATFFTRFALGAVFGVSLALLGGFADLTPEGLQRRWLPLLVSAGLGFFIYLVIGKLAHVATREASHAASEGSWAKKASIYFGLTALLVILIAIEATVERKGIVQAAMDRVLETEGRARDLSSFDEFAFWAVAVVFAAPYALLEAYHGWVQARWERAGARRKCAVAERRRQLAFDPTVQSVAEHHSLARIAEECLALAPAEGEPRRREVLERIAELDRQLNEHPAFRLQAEFGRQRDEHLSHQILLAHAKAAWDEAAVAHQADPEYLAAREHAERLRSGAEADRSAADRLDAGVSAAMSQAIERIVSAAGVGVAQAICDLPNALVAGAATAGLGKAVASTLSGPGFTALNAAAEALTGPGGANTNSAALSLAVAVRREYYIGLARSLGTDAQFQVLQGPGGIVPAGNHHARPAVPEAAPAVGRPEESYRAPHGGSRGVQSRQPRARGSDR